MSLQMIYLDLQQKIYKFFKHVNVNDTQNCHEVHDREEKEKHRKAFLGR